MFEHVFFYGAGASTETMCAIVRNGLKLVSECRVIRRSRSGGCAYATYDGEPCISCILGTGSNSCYFDGKSIYEEVPSLRTYSEMKRAEVLKNFATRYLLKKLPEDLARRLMNILK